MRKSLNLSYLKMRGILLLSLYYGKALSGPNIGFPL